MVNNKVSIKLWVDDIRDPVEHGKIGWTWARTYEEAIHYFTDYDVVEASLDHDLGWMTTIGYGYPDTDPRYEKTGYDIVKWMVLHNVKPVHGTHVHSANPVGAKNMRMLLDSFYKEEY